MWLALHVPTPRPVSPRLPPRPAPRWTADRESGERHQRLDTDKGPQEAADNTALGLALPLFPRSALL